MNPYSRLVISCWEELRWRHHGTGMMQAYIPGSAGTARVHVWHPDLLLPGMTESGAMHNHRFRFTSHVLVGQIRHTFLHVAPVDRGPFLEWQIGLASRSADKDLVPVRAVEVLRGDTRMIGVGESHHTYTVEKWTYHHAEPVGLAVTLVHIEDKSDDRSASLVSPWGVRPVAAFGEQADPGTILDILNDARVALDRVEW